MFYSARKPPSFVSECIFEHFQGSIRSSVVVLTVSALYRTLSLEVINAVPAQWRSLALSSLDQGDPPALFSLLIFFFFFLSLFHSSTLSPIKTENHPCDLRFLRFQNGRWLWAMLRVCTSAFFENSVNMFDLFFFLNNFELQNRMRTTRSEVICRIDLSCRLIHWPLLTAVMCDVGPSLLSNPPAPV